MSLPMCFLSSPKTEVYRRVGTLLDQLPTEGSADITKVEVGARDVGQKTYSIDRVRPVVPIGIVADAGDVLGKLQGDVVVGAHGDTLERFLFVIGQSRRKADQIGAQDPSRDGDDHRLGTERAGRGLDGDTLTAPVDGGHRGFELNGQSLAVVGNKRAETLLAEPVLASRLAVPIVES